MHITHSSARRSPAEAGGGEGGVVGGQMLAHGGFGYRVDPAVEENTLWLWYSGETHTARVEVTAAHHRRLAEGPHWGHGLQGRGQGQGLQGLLGRGQGQGLGLGEG